MNGMSVSVEVESQNNPPLQQPQSLEKPITFLRTCFNGINVLSGVGILSTPYALSQGGWLSLVLLVTVAILCWYTGILLHRCMNDHPTAITYPDIGALAFGTKGKALVSIFIYLELYLVVIDFLILEGDNLAKLFPKTTFGIFNLKLCGKHGFVILTALVILPTTWLRSLGLLAYVSAGGVLASTLVLFCVFWVGAFDGVGFHEKGKVISWSGMPTSISLFSFCYCGHALFPTLCSSMRDKAQFSKVLIICFIISTISYGSMGIIGYLMYGETLNSQVTLNLPLHKIASQIAIYTTLLTPLTKYALVLSPIATAIEHRLSLRRNVLFSILIRTALVISTTIVALWIPFFGYVMAFIGAFIGVAGSMLLPCLCYLKINKSSRRFGFELIIILMILVMGSCIGVIGTYTSLRHIIDKLRES